MAQLPGEAANPPIVPQADRPLVSYRGGLAQEAAVGAAESRAQLGETMFKSGMSVLDTQDKINRAAAEQTFLSKKLDIDEQFSRDPDYATAPQRYRQALQQALGDTSGSIRGAVQRSDFTNSMSRWVEYGTNTQLRESNRKWTDAGRGNTVDAMNQAIGDALRAPDEATRAAIFGTVHTRIDAAQQQGWFTATEAAKYRKNIPEAYAAGRAKMMADADPAAAVRALQPTGVGEDGTPTFDKTGDWRDYLDPAKRMDTVRAAEAHAQEKARAAEVDALRQERIQDKARKDAAEKAGNGIVSQLIKDPTQVDANTIANDPSLDFTQKWHLHEMQKAALQQQGDGKDTKTYGPGYWQAFQAVHAPDGDPGKITDPAQLWPRGGPNGDLTASGIDKLTAEIQAKRTPEGEAESEMKKAFLANARGQITGTNEGLHLKDPKGDELYLKFLAQALPAIDAGKKAGKSAAQLLNPDSSDYVGKIIGQFKRPMAQWASDMLNDNAPGPPAVDLTSQAGVVAAYQAGKIDRDAAGAALTKLGIKYEQAGAPEPRAPIR